MTLDDAIDYVTRLRGRKKARPLGFSTALAAGAAILDALTTERTRREAAEREREAAVLEVNDLHEAWHNQVTALRERAEKAEAERDEARAEVALANAMRVRYSGVASPGLAAEAALAEALASRDAALAALAEVEKAVVRGPCDGKQRRPDYYECLLCGARANDAHDDARRDVVHAPDCALAASPAALGAKVIADAEERGAKAMQAAAVRDCEYQLASVPTDEAQFTGYTNAGMGILGRIQAHNPAEVCKAAGGGR